MDAVSRVDEEAVYCTELNRLRAFNDRNQWFGKNEVWVLWGLQCSFQQHHNQVKQLSQNQGQSYTLLSTSNCERGQWLLRRSGRLRIWKENPKRFQNTACFIVVDRVRSIVFW